MALQPDGKVIVALVCNNGGDIRAGKRLDIAGQIDPAYNYPGGTPFGVPVESGEYGLKPVLQADGRTVFAASSYNVAPNPVTLDFNLARRRYRHAGRHLHRWRPETDAGCERSRQ